MGDEAYTPRQTPHSRNSEHSTNQHRAIYAMGQAKRLFGSYRRADANDPETYVASIAAVLSLYEPSLILEVTDPRTGIQTDQRFETFMPNAGELKRYCEKVADRRARMARMASLPSVPYDRQLPAPEPQPGDLANVFIAADHPRYERLVEMAKLANPRLWKFGRAASDGRPGIWVAWNLLEDGPSAGKRLGDAAKTVVRDAAE